MSNTNRSGWMGKKGGQSATKAARATDKSEQAAQPYPDGPPSPSDKEYAEAWPLWFEHEEAEAALRLSESLVPKTVTEDRDKPETVALKRKALEDVRARLQALNSSRLQPGTPAPGVAAGSGMGWTPERLEELSVYRETHGTKKAAAHFGVSESRVRKLLPRGKPRTKGYSVFSPGQK